MGSSQQNSTRISEMLVFIDQYRDRFSVEFIYVLFTRYAGADSLLRWIIEIQGAVILVRALRSIVPIQRVKEI